MARMHLFEFEDQSWCPSFVREATTDCLSVLYRALKVYEPAYKKIEEILDKAKINQIIDCCSGSGGPIKILREHLDAAGKEAITITLTDKYPNLKAFASLEAAYPNKINGQKNSLDASNLPASLKGMRTFFSSFHHFQPDKALKILQDAVNNNSPIGIFELTQRHPREFVRVFLSPLTLLCTLPFAKNLTWRKFLFTYIIPITPFTHMWEFFASNMRTYSPKELQALIDQLDAPGYQWEVGKLWSKKALCEITYLTGYKS